MFQDGYFTSNQSSSGKRLHNDGKSPFFYRKIHYKYLQVAVFNRDVSHYQRVNHHLFRDIHPMKPAFLMGNPTNQ